jgi:hypothetical protein
MERGIMVARIPVEKHRFLILLGVLGLIIGSFLYLADRNPDDVYFIYKTGKGLSLFHRLPNFFGYLGYWLPTFLHPFSFSLLSAAVCSASIKNYAAICLFWCGINILFEIGQRFKAIAVGIVPDWFAGIPYLENTKGYFVNGTFDYVDIVSIMLGASTAFVILLISAKREIRSL